MKPILFLIISFFLFSTSCKKNKKCSRGYDLEHPISVYPIQDSYSVGDTIWFEMNFSDYFDALVTNNFTGEQWNQTIQLKNFDFHRNFLRVIKLTDPSQNINGQQTGTWDASFDPIYITGNFIQELPDGPEYQLAYSNGNYRLKQGLILQQTGTYIFYPKFMHYYPTAEDQYNLQDLTPECEQEIITNIYFPVNKQANGTSLTNYHLFEQLMDPSLEPGLDGIKTRTFTFVVN